MAVFEPDAGSTGPHPAAYPIRETLFGDLPLDQWPAPNSAAKEFPWNVFEAARVQHAAGNQAAAVDYWQQIIAQPNLEPRHYLQACFFLRMTGHPPPLAIARQLLGVVIEVGMPGGLDLLAVYADYSARYYNFSGAGVVWEHPGPSLDPAIDQLQAAAKIIIEQTGPGKPKRPEPPLRAHARLNCLTPNGIYFVQGPMSGLARDPVASRVLNLGAVLIQALIAKAGHKHTA